MLYTTLLFREEAGYAKIFECLLVAREAAVAFSDFPIEDVLAGLGEILLDVEKAVLYGVLLWALAVG